MGSLVLLDSVAGDVFDHPIDGARLRAYLAAPHQALFVAVGDGQVIGQCRALICLHPDGPPTLEVENLGVTPARRRQGIATALFRAALDWGRAQGATDWWVGTEVGNDAAVAFYRTLVTETDTFLLFEGNF